MAQRSPVPGTTLRTLPQSPAREVVDSGQKGDRPATPPRYARGRVRGGAISGQRCGHLLPGKLRRKPEKTRSQTLAFFFLSRQPGDRILPASNVTRSHSITHVLTLGPVAEIIPGSQNHGKSGPNVIEHAGAKRKAGLGCLLMRRDADIGLEQPVLPLFVRGPAWPEEDVPIEHA